MTVASSYTAPQYTGNGTSAVFAFPYPFFSPSDLQPLLYDLSAAASVSPSPVLNGTATYDYTVVGAQDAASGEYLAGGSIMFNTAPPGNYQITIVRNVQAVQSASLATLAPFPAKTIEAALDRITMVAQQLAVTQARGVQLNPNDPTAELLLPPVALRAGQILGFDSNGNAIPAQPSSALVSTVMQAVVSQGSLSGAISALFTGNTMSGVVLATSMANAVAALFTGSILAGVIEATSLSNAISALFSGSAMAPVIEASSPTAAYAALLAGSIGGVGGRNRLINGTWLINQRSYAGSALSAGAYGHDRWKAGASGCTYSASSNGADTTITITAGSLQQVIEGAWIEGGSYTLSWTGTAQARVNGGAYAASPMTVTALSAGSAVTIEFATGTVGKAQFEPGALATPFERRSPQSEMAMCQRYYQSFPTIYGVGNSILNYTMCFAQMRVTPTISIGSWTITGGTSFYSLTAISNNSLNLSVSGSGGIQASANTVTLSAEL